MLILLFTLLYAESLSYSDSDSKLDFPDSDVRDAKVSGLKILTPNQMLSRLPISLAQLKTRNNSEKLKKGNILCTDQKTYRITL